jgi:hypothetical protein
MHKPSEASSASPARTTGDPTHGHVEHLTVTAAFDDGQRQVLPGMEKSERW